jgi:DoxX-like protein
MQSDTQTAPVSNERLWAGRIISAVPVLFLIFDGVGKLINPAPVVAAFVQLGYPDRLAPGIGILELACAAVYAIPRTSVLGAILLTGFLGGAIAAHLRVGDPVFTHLFFPIYVGALVWAGIFLREDRLYALVPLRN